MSRRHWIPTYLSLNMTGCLPLLFQIVGLPPIPSSGALLSDTLLGCPSQCCGWRAGGHEQQRGWPTPFHTNGTSSPQCLRQVRCAHFECGSSWQSGAGTSFYRQDIGKAVPSLTSPSSASALPGCPTVRLLAPHRQPSAAAASTRLNRRLPDCLLPDPHQSPPCFFSSG